MEKIKLLLVDDHAVVRSGLRMLLETQPDVTIAGEAENGADAISLARQLSPDVIVMDITLPDISGIEATRRIHETCPNAAIVALTIHEDEQYFFEMLAAGASGYVPKRAAPEDLLTAIRAAHRGEVFLHPTMAKALVKDFVSRVENGKAAGVMDGLTDREREVLKHLAEGASNQDIADVLGISANTVARHRENIMQKLNLHSRAELVKYAIRKGLIEA
ncbi:MAG: response regulator transcription factor [Chloroflexi bacterium]|nr:response regulator transcription factor [Chloroflexota bacterium]MBI3762100.1 response regulator transcription factor [Chloroflexota bacterium]